MVTYLLMGFDAKNAMYKASKCARSPRLASGLSVAVCRCAAESTVVCGTRQAVLGVPSYQLCPADCGQRYIPERDCLKCLCGVGKQGDVNVGFDEPCPPGFDHRANDAFFRTCGPIDDLRK